MGATGLIWVFRPTVRKALTVATGLLLFAQGLDGVYCGGAEGWLAGGG